MKHRLGLIQTLHGPIMALVKHRKSMLSNPFTRPKASGMTRHQAVVESRQYIKRIPLRRSSLHPRTRVRQLHWSLPLKAASCIRREQALYNLFPQPSWLLRLQNSRQSQLVTYLSLASTFSRWPRMQVGSPRLQACRSPMSTPASLRR